MPQKGRSLSLRGALVLCGLSGALLCLSFPRPGWWALAWVALVPWIVSLRMSSRLGLALGSWLGGVIFFGGLLYWLGLFGISVLLLVSVLFGAVLMLWGLLVGWTGRLSWAPRMLGAAALWCGLEWARGLGSFGCSWGWLGYSQTPYPPLLAVARLVGALGLSFLIVLFNAALAEAVTGLLLRRPPLAPIGRALAGAAVVALALLAAHSWDLRHPLPSGTPISVAVVQGSVHGPLDASAVNISPTAAEQERNLDTYVSLTTKAARAHPMLVVWPESALSAPPDTAPWLADRLARLTRRTGIWLVAGAPRLDSRGRNFNSLYLYSPTGNIVRHYDKVQRVPFGEYVPGRSWLPLLDRYHIRESDFSAGDTHHVLQAGTIPVGPMICFESIFPTISWQLVSQGAEILVIATNDAWFGHTAAAAQHQQIAVMRAAETGRWVLRAASTGISSIITPEGRVVEQAPLYRPAVLSHRAALLTQSSPGCRWGPIFSWVMFALAIAFVIAPAARPSGRRPARGAQPRSRPRRRG